MRHFVKYILLFAFVVLGYSGSEQGRYAEAVYTLPRAAEANKEPDKLSANELYKLAGLQRAEERVNTAQSQPAPPSKGNAGSLLAHSYALELKVQSLVSQQVLRSRLICLSLTVREIIFPFHYFW